MEFAILKELFFSKDHLPMILIGDLFKNQFSNFSVTLLLPLREQNSSCREKFFRSYREDHHENLVHSRIRFLAKVSDNGPVDWRDRNDHHISQTNRHSPLSG